MVDECDHRLSWQEGPSRTRRTAPLPRLAGPRLTRANERAVRNWFEAKNAPSGENLVILMRLSDEVLETVLRLADRQDLVAARKLSAARGKLEEMLAMIDDLQAR